MSNTNTNNVNAIAKRVAQCIALKRVIYSRYTQHGVFSSLLPGGEAAYAQLARYQRQIKVAVNRLPATEYEAVLSNSIPDGMGLGYSRPAGIYARRGYAPAIAACWGDSAAVQDRFAAAAVIRRWPELGRLQEALC